jgi:hypothetical protein
MKSGRIDGERLAQRRQTEVLRVEGVTIIERLLCDVADEIRCHFIWFAEPERQDIGAAHTCVRDFTNAGRTQRLYRWAGLDSMGHRRRYQRHSKN